MCDFANDFCISASYSLAMYRLDPADLDALVALARYGTLSAAAKKQGVAVSTLSRRIDALETRLGITLVDRQMRGSRLTEAGRAIAIAAEPLSAQLDRIDALAASLAMGANQRAIRVSATEMVVSDVLAPQLGEWARQPERPPIELRSEAEIVSLAARNADIAIRMSRPVGASLIIRKLPALTLGFYASPGYLSGRTPNFAGFGDERLLAYDDSYGPLPETAWIDQHRLGQAVTLRSGSTRALLNAARSGAGIALLPAVIAARYADLIEILTPLRIPARVPFLTVHRDLQRDRAVRSVADWAAACFHRLTRLAPVAA
jgi:DNA-binding transcriptional LysR family regulator